MFNFKANPKLILAGSTMNLLVYLVLSLENFVLKDQFFVLFAVNY